MHVCKTLIKEEDFFLVLVWRICSLLSVKSSGKITKTAKYLVSKISLPGNKKHSPFSSSIGEEIFSPFFFEVTLQFFAQKKRYVASHVTYATFFPSLDHTHPFPLISVACLLVQNTRPK